MSPAQPHDQQAADSVPDRRRGGVRINRSARPGSVPAQRSRPGRLGSRLPRRARQPAGARARRARRRAGQAARARPRASRGVRRGAGRPGPGGRSGADPLAAPRLVRVLPGPIFAARGAGRTCRGRPGRAGHAVVHVAGRHRDRVPCARLAGGPAGRAPGVEDHRSGRRGAAVRRVGVHAHRTGGGPRAVPDAQRGGSQGHGRLHVEPRPLVDREGCPHGGYGHVRLLETDHRFAARPEALAKAIAGDRRAGLVPAFMGSAVGTTGTTGVDPVRRLGEIARAEQMWHHIDAATPAQP